MKNGDPGSGQAMDFVVAAARGTHLYRAVGSEKPVLLRTIAPARPGLPRCIEVNEERSCLAVLLHTGTLGVWDLSQDCLAPVCEIPGQSAPVARCYFSPKGSFVAAWEPIGTFHRVEQRGMAESQRKAFTKTENLAIWSLVSRGETGSEFSVEIVKDGTQRLGVNVDHEDGRNGLLVRRVDPGLVMEHNGQSEPSQKVLPGDRILSVNGKERMAQLLAEEIQKASRLQMRVRRGPTWCTEVLARFFAPSTNPLRWPPVPWSASEQFAFRCVTNEVLVLDGHTLKSLRRIQIDNVLQMSIAQSALQLPKVTSLAVFCQGGTSASPSMVRVYSDIEAIEPGRGPPRASITKSFFSDVAWVTVRWDPVTATDAFILVHSSELTEADVEGRTLHGQGGNGLFLIRSEEASEPVFSVSGSQDGAIFDAQWCPTQVNNARRLLLLQGPQPSLLSVVTYRPGSGIAPERVDIGRFGVRNCLRWDHHGRSFCLRALSLGGAGVSNEADTIDIFDVALNGAVQWRASASAAGKKEKEQALGPSIQSLDISPNGKVALGTVGSHVAVELKFWNVEDGSPLYRLKFDEIFAAYWQPVPSGLHPVPEFPPPPPPQARAEMLAARAPAGAAGGLAGDEDENGTGNGRPGELQQEHSQPAKPVPRRKGPAPKAVNMEDRDSVRRRVRALQKKLREIERLRSLPETSLDTLQKEKLVTEPEVRQNLAMLERELDLLERLPVMVFDVETESGVQHIEYRPGDSCMELARQFVKEQRMREELIEPLAQHMELRLKEQNLISDAAPSPPGEE